MVMCSFPLVSISQNKKIDSLKFLLPSNSLVKQADILYGLAYEYVDLDFKLGLVYAKEAFNTAKRTGDSLRIVKAGRIKSLAFRRLNKIDSSLTISVQILPIARRNYFNEEMESILNGLALAYMFKAFYDKALKCFFELLELRQKGGDKSEISIALHGIGLVYYKLKDFDNAISYFKRAMQLKQEVNEKDDMDLLLNNIGLCYAYKDNFTVAQDYVMQAFTLCKPTCSKVFLLHTYFSLGVIAIRQQNYSIAEIQFLKSYDLAKQLNDERYQLDNIIFLLSIYIIKNQVLLAEGYLKKADKLIESGTPYNLELIKIYSQFSKLYGKLNDFKKVIFYQNKYIGLKDSIYNDELTTNLMKVEALHLEKENKAKIEFQNIILVLNKEVISRQKFLNVFIGIIALLLILLTLALLKSNRHKRIVNHLLDEKVKERTHDLELNRDALQRACEARDALLYKTSSDINDSIATVKGLCLLGLKDIEDPRAREYLEKMNAASDKFSVVLRNLHLTRLEL